MIGAKVDMEKAKKERLCFNCGKAGHQAKFRRNKKTFAKKEGTTRISMMTYRKDPGQEKLQYVPTPENSNMFTEESESEINYNQLCRDEITGHDDNYEHRQTIRKEMEAEFFAAGLGKDQGETGSPQTDEFEDEPSVNDADLQLKNELISEWRMNVQEKLSKKPELRREARTLGESMEPRRQPEGATVHDRPSGEPLVPGTYGRIDPEIPITAEMIPRRSFANREKASSTKENPLLKIWKQQRPRESDEKEKIQRDVKRCTCYQFDPRCWARSGYGWNAHRETCRKCNRWGQQDCEVRQHSTTEKTRILNEISQARATWGKAITSNDGKNCCELKRCTHKFINHGREDIPWWACLNKYCDDHEPAKRKNGIWPIIPVITIRNAQNCPCFREGCECSWLQKHPFHVGLIPKKLCSCTKHEKIVIRKVNQGVGQQLVKTVIVKGRKVLVVIDCGANVNYINKAWSERIGIKAKDYGEATVKAYSGREIKERLSIASVKFNGKEMEYEFRVLKETGSDKMVLGIPWLDN